MRGRRVLLLLLAAALAGLAAAVLARHAPPLPSPAALVGHVRTLAAYRAAHPARSAILYLLVCTGFAALPVPGAELLAVGAGTVFGLAEGTALVAFAVTLGSCGAFLFGRFLLRGAVERHLRARLTVLARGLDREGAFYLFALRLIPAIPFFVVNVAMGATPLRLKTFAWVSAIGVLPSVVAYVNAGRMLGQLQSFGGILSPGIIASFALLGVLPLAARRLVLALRRRGLGGGRAGGHDPGED